MSLSVSAARARRGAYLRPSAARTRAMGDPGLFGFLGSVVKGAVGSIPVVGGALSGALSGLGGSSSPSRTAAMTRSAPLPMAQPGPGGGQLPGMRLPLPGPRSLQLQAPVAFPMDARGAPSANGGPPPSGYHLNKADYFLRDGTFVPKGTRYVKNRRRDPLNPRALRNAIARVDAGKTWQGKLREIETGKYTKAGAKKSCG